jgi:hypothetical protein
MIFQCPLLPLRQSRLGLHTQSSPRRSGQPGTWAGAERHRRAGQQVRCSRRRSRSGGGVLLLGDTLSVTCGALR